MAQLDPIQRSYNQSSPKNLKGQTSPTFEQLLQDDPSNWQPNTSPSLAKNDPSNWTSNPSTSPAKNQQDSEEWSAPQNKKSVLTKVKEKAKKLKHTLSGKKKNDYADGSNSTSFGVNVDEDEEEIDEDPEYLGAPMYESVMAPENYKENARQNPRANPVVPEKHAAPSCVRNENEEGKQNPANKTISEAVTERLAPAYAAVSGATTTIASKVASLTTIKPKDQEKDSAPFPSPAESDTEYSAASDFENSDRSSEYEERGTRSPPNSDKGVSVKEYFMNKLEPGENERALSQVISEAISPKKGADENKSVAGKVCAAVTSILQVPSQPASKEKSISVHPSPLNKLEPGENERALSQVISESISPKKGADENKSVAGKVRAAVTSLLQVPSQPASKEKSISVHPSPLTAPKLLRQKSVHTTNTNYLSNNPMSNRVASSSPPIPISTNPREADEDESYDRILQAN